MSKLSVWRESWTEDRPATVFAIILLAARWLTRPVYCWPALAWGIIWASYIRSFGWWWIIVFFAGILVIEIPAALFQAFWKDGMKRAVQRQEQS